MLEAASILWQILAKQSWFKLIVANLFLIMPLGTILGLFTLLITYADDIHTQVGIFASYVGSSTWGAYYAKINVIIPMTEALGIAGVLLTLKGLTTLARWVKSWIPTVN